MAGIGAEARVYYAGKALLTKAVATWAASEGLGIDCSTEGELAVALAAGIPGPKIGLHGNNKSDAEIATALDHGIGHIIIDSLEEIERIAAAAEARGMKAPVMVRAVTGVHAGGHEYISTGHQDQKFGLSMERRAGSSTSPAMSALCQAAEDERLNLLGIHSHIGSQILGAEGFEESAHAVMGLRAGLLARTGYEVPEVNLGGGYGIAYLPGDEPLDLEAAAQSLATAIKFSCDAFKISVPRIAFEPGRSIAGPAGLTLYTVGAIKDIVLPDASVEADKATARATPPTRRYISIDGGMSDNLRPALYGARYHAELANRVSNAPLQLSRIVGKHCESGDIVVQEIMLPSDVRRGDIIATPATGAYGRSMANNYNQMPRPPVVAVADGASRVILRRETVADLLALDEG
jgi:diaminopimelate decarboxylase